MWRRWCEQVLEQRRLRAVAKKVLGHWRNRLLSSAFEKMWYEVLRRRKAKKALTIWKNGKGTHTSLCADVCARANIPTKSVLRARAFLFVAQDCLRVCIGRGMRKSETRSASAWSLERL